MYHYEFPQGISITLDIDRPHRVGLATYWTPTQQSYFITPEREKLFRETDSKSFAVRFPKDHATQKLLCGTPDAMRQYRKENTIPMLEDDLENLAWLSTPSTLCLRIFFSLYVGSARRNSDNAPACTHFNEMAHFAYNNMGDCWDPETKRTVPRDVVAFILQSHDALEDFRKAPYCDADGNRLPPMTSGNIVKYCWRGDPSWGVFIARMIEEFTDDPSLKGQSEKRMDAQVVKVNADKTRILARGRFADKFFTRLHDLRVMAQGKIPTREDILEHLAKFRLKARTILRMQNLRRDYKKMMGDVVKEFFSLTTRYLCEQPTRPEIRDAMRLRRPPSPHGEEKRAAARGEGRKPVYLTSRPNIQAKDTLG